MDDQRLKEKLRAIEALIAGATTEGERAAAEYAKERIAARLRERHAEPEAVWRFTGDPWSRQLLVALARRYGLEPFRWKGQRRSTVMLRGPLGFLRGTFIPAFVQMEEMLHQHLTAMTERVIAEALHANVSEPAEVEREPGQLVEAVAPAPSGAEPE